MCDQSCLTSKKKVKTKMIVSNLFFRTSPIPTKVFGASHPYTNIAIEWLKVIKNNKIIHITKKEY